MPGLAIFGELNFANIPESKLHARVELTTR
jgi:hypothetical protein